MIELKSINIRNRKGLRKIAKDINNIGFRDFRGYFVKNWLASKKEDFKGLIGFRCFAGQPACFTQVNLSVASYDRKVTLAE